ncbi:unnamed protein product [Meganyctiphanes norvegica]|uniref:Uncharacterized protein n=1 Tax=Meganyctiphanes norvegica TaxID=48144 RepID=A0AAV2RF58_MEGNR
MNQGRGGGTTVVGNCFQLYFSNPIDHRSQHLATMGVTVFDSLDHIPPHLATMWVSFFESQNWTPTQLPIMFIWIWSDTTTVTLNGSKCFNDSRASTQSVDGV